MTHAANVTSAREALGLSQVQLARIAGTTQQTISRIEAGSQCPTDGMRRKIAKALGKATVDVFPYDDEVGDDA